MKGVIAVVAMLLVIAAASPMLEIGFLLLAGFILVTLDVIEEDYEQYRISVW